MLTLASILMFAQFRIGRNWALWPLLLGLALSAVAAQLVSITGMMGLRAAGLALAAPVFLSLLVRGRRRGEWPMAFWARSAKAELAQTLEYLRGAGASGRAALVLFAAIFLALLLYAFLYLPLPIDDYNAVYAGLLVQHDSLRVGPVLNQAISSLGFLNEYLVADLALVPVIGGMLVKILPATAWCVFAFSILHLARRKDPQRRLFWSWVALAAFPMVVWSLAALYKNDMLTMALCLPPLYITAYRLRCDEREFLVQMGAMAGFAVATKLSAAMVPLAMMLFLPFRGVTGFFRSRIAVGLGAAAGAICGGLPFIFWSNWSRFGSILGPLRNAHLLTGEVVDRLQGVLAFLNSVFNPLVLFLLPLNAVPEFLRSPEMPSQVSASRLSLTALFALCFIAYMVQLARGRARWWPGVVSLSVIAVVAILNRDLYFTHRYIAAPALLLMFEALRAVSRDDAARKPYVIGPFLAVSLLVVLQTMIALPTLFDKLEFLRDRDSAYGRLLASVEQKMGHLLLRPEATRSLRAYERRINDAALSSRRVANGAYEYFLDLQGVPYRQIYAWQGAPGEFVPQWSLDGLDRFDLIIIDLNLPPPEILRRHFAERCSLLEPDPGAALPVRPALRAYRCKGA